MWAYWFASVVFVWLAPSALACCNPFLAPIARAIRNRQVATVLLGSYLTGLVADLLLSSPKLGILGLSSLLAAVMVMKIASFFSVEGWQSIVLVALLASVQGLLNPFLCALTSQYSFTTLFSWKQFVLFVVLSSLWAAGAGLCAAILRWWSIKRLRRSTE